MLWIHLTQSDDNPPGFTGNLRAVINKVYAPVNIDEVLPDISLNICTYSTLIA
ncbi:hypothetical protein NSMM_310015 [Nitrosomonas mobilis]|uniref:Uncharacterized protein n=1 Tax=Nitrosomonas mobilis TaxID=51642 RepID=A0A1G5SCM1_9PROT|nr:hypothetical protein NSMM_310015 [Nitrosomonas mobilis]